MAITYNEFIKKYLGKKIDFDGACGCQCVDLATAYFYECFDSGIKNFWYDAHHFFDNFYQNDWLKNNFERISNDPYLVPLEGDVCVFGGGKWGHICIATGEGNVTYFYSYDTNATGNNDPVTRVKHSYKNFLGVLRPKAKPLDIDGIKQGDNNLSVYLLKYMFKMAGETKIDDNKIAGKGTRNIINKYLKKWGYPQNGIAGINFIRKFGSTVLKIKK